MNILVESFEVTIPTDVPIPTVGKVYPASKTNGIYHLIIEDEVSFFIPEKGETSWYKAKIKEVSENAEEPLFQDDPLEIPIQAILDIQLADVYMIDAVSSLLHHVASTYSDKYEEEMPMVDNTWLKYGSGKYPAGHNVGQAVNYLKRYLSEGYSKSYNIEDLKKAAHFILFEIGRRENEV